MPRAHKWALRHTRAHKCAQVSLLVALESSKTAKQEAKKMPDVHTNIALSVVANSDLGEPFSQSLREFLTDLRTTDQTVNAMLAAYIKLDEIINKKEL